MHRVKYVFVPDRNPRSFRNRIKPTLIRKLFPFLRGILASRLGWVRYYSQQRGYDFVQLAAHGLQRLYRRFLRQNAAAALSVINEEEASMPSLATVQTGYGHAICYNCKPSFCSFYTPNGGDNKRRRCRQRFCPSCHFSRAHRLITRLRSNCRPVLQAWPSTLVHCYEAKFDASTNADEVRAKLVNLTRKLGRRRNVVGMVWYFRPIFVYVSKRLTLFWRARLMVIASADFHLRDEEKRASCLSLIKAKHITEKVLVRSVGWLLSWGHYPFWYNEQIVSAWNQVLATGKIFSCSGIASKNVGDYVTLRHFYRLAAKARQKVAARERENSRKKGGTRPRPPVSLLRANQVILPCLPHAPLRNESS